MSKYILMHGTFYEVPDNHQAQRNIKYVDLGPGELAHFKYIKREKLPGGGYRYYYDDSEMKRAEAELKVAQQGATLAEKKYEQAKQKEMAKRPWGAYFTHDPEYRKIKSEHEEAARERDNAARLKGQAQRNYKEVEKKYNQKKVSTFAARTISKGIVKVANLFSKLFK